MTLPASGQLSFRDIHYEIYTTYPSSNDDVGLYNPLTVIAGYQPKAEPHMVSEFFGYDHSSYATLTVVPTSWLTIPQGGGTKGITVNATVGNAWLASSDQAWLTFQGGFNSGTGNGSFTLVAAVNSDGAPDRIATVTIVSDAPDATVDCNQYWH